MIEEKLKNEIKDFFKINRDEEVTIKGIEKTNRGFSFIYLTIGNMKFGIFPKKKNEFWMAILDLKEDGAFEISRKINDVLKLGSAYLIYDDINKITTFVEKVYGYNTNIIFDGKMFDFEKESVMIKLEGLK